MRTFNYLSLLVSCCILMVATSSKSKPANEPEPNAYIQKKTGSGVVVMELFTSQGCSSCPPADNLLGQYATKNDDQIIALAFHVDYWNRLGWTDSFSSKKYSNRQRDYASSIKNSSVYTPQLIINGTSEFVGSDQYKIENAVATALKQQPEISISIEKITKIGNNASINYAAGSLATEADIHCALIQKEVFTNILKGENQGLKLRNYNVVRDFVSKPLTTKYFTTDLHLPAGYPSKDFAVVIFAQQKSSGKIIGAVKKDL